MEEESSQRGCTEVRRRWYVKGNESPLGMTRKPQVNRKMMTSAASMGGAGKKISTTANQLSTL